MLAAAFLVVGMFSMIVFVSAEEVSSYELPLKKGGRGVWQPRPVVEDVVIPEFVSESSGGSHVRLRVNGDGSVSLFTVARAVEFVDGMVLSWDVGTVGFYFVDWAGSSFSVFVSDGVGIIVKEVE